MRKLILTATGFLCLAGGSYFLNTSSRHRRRSRRAEDVPHRVGLIDIGYVSRNYEKVKYRTEEITVETKDAQAKFNAKVEKRSGLCRTQMKELNEGQSGLHDPGHQSRRSWPLSSKLEQEMLTRRVSAEGSQDDTTRCISKSRTPSRSSAITTNSRSSSASTAPT